MPAEVLPLLAWLSPSYPVGAYAYSHGLESAVEAGDVRDEATLAAWLRDVLRHGAGHNDAILLHAAHRAATAGDGVRLVEANDLALALAPSAELRLETSQQGRSFLDATVNAWPCPGLLALAPALDREVAYPVAVGLASAAHGLDSGATASAYLLALMQNLVSAAIRLAPVGQGAGTRVVAGLVAEAASTARETAGLDLDDVGGCMLRADLGSFLHETQYTRIFRS